jgi:hypothetical protein
MHCSKMSSSFDYLVGQQLHGVRDGQSERPGSPQIDDELEFALLLDGQISRRSPLRMRPT